MSKICIFILSLGLCGVGLFPLACGKNISPTSSSSGTTTPATTATATATVNAASFSTIYQNSVSPSSSYSGELDVWASGHFLTTSEGSTPYLEVTTGTIGENAYSRCFVQFTGVSLPTNVTVLGGEVWLTLESATNVSGSVTIGLHSFSSSLYPSATTPAWTSTADWQGPGAGTGYWYSYDGGTSTDGEQFRIFNSTPNSTVVFTNAANGTNGVYRFTLNASDIQNELSSGVIQFILRSEGEFSGDIGTSLIGFYPNTDTTGKAPKLLISYQ